MADNSNEIINALKRFDTPTVCNAVELLELRDRTDGFMGMNIRCWFPEMDPMVGYAVTATVRSTVPGPPASRHGFLPLFDFIRNSPKPSVLVFKDVGPNGIRSCHFGDMMATICSRLGAIGLVTDGGIRDITTVRELGFHYFSPGATPAHGNYEIVDSGIDVDVGGVVVKPGNLIHADENGVGVFPVDRIQDLVNAAQTVRDRENSKLKALNDPRQDPMAVWSYE